MNGVWRTDQIHLDSVFPRSESRGFSRYFIAGDVTNVWAALGDLGATTLELDRFSLMGAARGVETAFRRKGPNRLLGKLFSQTRRHGHHSRRAEQAQSR